VNSYGKGIDDEISFAELLRKINGIEGDFRIRFMTSHPKDATKELIDVMAQCDKVCKHLHLPVQCGSNRVLKQMNRSYTVEKYLEIVDYAKEKIPDISFTSDIIVGFPSETYEEFLLTAELIKKVEYDLVYTFVYSKREGTKAALMQDEIPEKQKGLWVRELVKIQEDITMKRMSALVGKTIRVLVDGKGKNEGYLTGRSDTNIVVEFIGDNALIGEFVDVKITTPQNWAVIGEKV
jgi:tRNA-2-methylthio-N6-dimethylallyladenosine synthase